MDLALIISHQTLDKVETAIRYAETVHGKLTKDPARAALILAEECGEVAKEALGLTRSTASPTTKAGLVNKMYEELAQVAALALLMMENLK